jgi:GTP1/Obg family GTP-binding protein
MSNKKRTVYRHPVTNKFISKKEWEELQKEDNTEIIEHAKHAKDAKYDEEVKKFIDGIEKEFDELVKTIPSQEELHPSGWKLFLNKLKFWV